MTRSLQVLRKWAISALLELKPYWQSGSSSCIHYRRFFPQKTAAHLENYHPGEGVENINIFCRVCEPHITRWSMVVAQNNHKPFYITILPLLCHILARYAVSLMIMCLWIKIMLSLLGLKKTFQGTKQLWRWARARSSHGGKAWRLAAANKSNKYVTSVRRKHFLFCSRNFQGLNIPITNLKIVYTFEGITDVFTWNLEYLNISMFIFSWKLKGTCCTSLVLKTLYWYFAFMSNRGCVDISMSSVS